MRSRQWKTFGWTVALACLLNFGLLSPGTVLADDDDDDQAKLVGSWICEVGGTVALLVNINWKGTFVVSSPVLNTSASHGVWKRTGNSTFDSTDFAFMYGYHIVTNLLTNTNKYSSMFGDEILTK